MSILALVFLLAFALAVSCGVSRPYPWATRRARRAQFQVQILNAANSARRVEQGRGFRHKRRWYFAAYNPHL